MRIIKPYGRSVVKITDRDEPSFARKIEIPDREENTEKAPKKVKARDTTGDQTQRIVDVGSPEHQNITFFIAQWASMLDKIIFKPEATKKEIEKFKNSPTHQARKQAANAIQALWMKEGLITHFNQEDLIKLWEKKVDPYDAIDVDKLASKDNDKDKKIITRRWFTVFSEGQSAEACDWTRIAENLYQHLYVKRKTLAGKTKKLGLIEARADSIRKNASKFKAKTGQLSCDSRKQTNHLNELRASSEPLDWTKVRDDYQLEALIEALNITLSKPPKDFRHYQIPLDCYKHFARVFGKDTTIDKATQSSPQLLAYHFAVKDTLKRSYPKNVHPNRKKSEQKRPLLTAESLHQLVIHHEDNHRLALAIRLGKVIHYEMEKDGPYKDNAPLVLPDAQAIASSAFWESQGQTLIKQNESFVRQWLGAIAMANSTLERLANPDLTIEDDITYKDTVDLALEKIDPLHFEHQFKLLFGNDHNLYDENNAAQRKNFATLLKQKLNALRKASFHFRSIDALNKALSPSLSTEKDHGPINVAIVDYVKKHFDLYNAQLTADLKAAHVETYLSDAQLTAVVDQLYADRRSLFPLPKFNKLLARAKHTDVTQVRNFPVSQKLMENRPELQCRFITMSALYSRAFGAWLEKRFIEHPQQARLWMEDAHKRATDAANKIQKSTELSSKMSRLRLLNDGETLTQYLSYVTSETAVEFAVQQNTYQSNPAQAKKQSNFVEDFKQDTIIRAFIDYLEELELRHMFFEEHSIPPQQAKSSLQAKAKPAKKTSLAYPWLYLVLHLMPIEIVNHLSLQLRKHFVLTQQEGYLDLHEAVSLFLGVHDAMLNVKSLNESEDLIAFYKDKSKFNRLFLSSTDDNANDSLIPVRGLRELLRFGNLHQLKLLFENAKVNSAQVRELTGMMDADPKSGKSAIVNAQEELQELHFNHCKQKHPSKEVLTDYQKHLATVIAFRNLKNHVYLHNPKQAHQLIMAIMGRLVGFSQLWERDIYFAILSLLVLRQIDVPNTGKTMKYLRKGMILSAYRGFENALPAHQAIAQTLEAIFDISHNEKCRNRLAHFDVLRRKGTDNKIESLKITPLINEVRTLMAYDRKLKNAVAKSIIDLALKHNICLTFVMENHGLFIKDVRSKMIKHLENNDLHEALHSETFIDVIKTLFDE